MSKELETFKKIVQEANECGMWHCATEINIVEQAITGTQMKDKEINIVLKIIENSLKKNLPTDQVVINDKVYSIEIIMDILTDSIYEKYLSEIFK